MFLLVPDPIVTVDAPSIQTVSKPLTLDCNVTTVSGITSRVDIVWSSNGLELRRIEGIKSNLTINDSVLYMDSYTIPQLGTVDEGRTYQCGIVINQAVPIIANGNITLDVTGEIMYIHIFILILLFSSYTPVVPKVLIDISQSVEGSVIGLPHTLVCTAIVVVGVSPPLVKVEWIGNTSLSESPRVTIFNQTSTGSQRRLKFARTVAFSPLLGHDIGEYTCIVTVTGFERSGNTESIMVMTNGNYVFNTYLSTCS